MPALSRMAPTALDCSSAVKMGLRIRRCRSSLPLDQLVEAVEIAGDGIHGIRFPGEFEQRRGIAQRYARQEGSFLRTALRHVTVSLVS